MAKAKNEKARSNVEWVLGPLDPVTIQVAGEVARRQLSNDFVDLTRFDIVLQGVGPKQAPMSIHRGLTSPEKRGSDGLGGDQQVVFSAVSEGAGFELGGL
jgi:hypothetical protein